MRHARWGILFLAACTSAEYHLDPVNPCKLDSRIDVVLESPEQMAPKSRAALRVLVTEEGRAATGLPVKAFLADKEIFAGTTDQGTCVVSFVVPDLPGPSASLRIETRDYVIRQDVKIQRDYRILLTTDKPLYQPGQVLKLRALALSSLTLKPVEMQELTFEVEDAKGNKVFKRKTKTSEFGVAHADFQLADEVVMGDWKISAFLGEITSSRTVGVRRYVLPKFRVELATDRAFYLPGERLTGTVRAEYFFGKPVAGEVAVKLLAVDAEMREVGRASGALAGGRWTFEMPLDSYFVGLPINHGMANVLLAAEVKDTAGHSEKSARAVPVAKEALQISVVPESGRLAEGVKNRIYIATYTPDGKPAPATVTTPFGSVETDETGVGILEYAGPGGPMQVVATDKSGRRTTTTVRFQEGEGLLVRPDRAMYRCGETMKVEVFSTVRRGTAFLDMVRGGQTLLTMSLPVADGRGVHAFDIPQDLFGGLEVRAYIVRPGGDIVRDSRIVYVDPSDDLKIDVVPGKDVYEPGEDATIRFHVTEGGKDVRAALGISIVDEAVFALEEMRPGLEKVYFTLHQELMTPKFGIKTLDPVACMIFAEVETNAAAGVTRNVVNTLEQRRRVMRPRLDRWYEAFERHIQRGHRYAVAENGSWKWAPGIFWEVSQHPGIRDRDMWDAWGGRMSLAKLEQWDSRFSVEHWMERRKP